MIHPEPCPLCWKFQCTCWQPCDSGSGRNGEDGLPAECVAPQSGDAVSGASPEKARARELREQIARKLHSQWLSRADWLDPPQWDDLDQRFRDEYFADADAILALSEHTRSQGRGDGLEEARADEAVAEAMRVTSEELHLIALRALTPETLRPMDAFPQDATWNAVAVEDGLGNQEWRVVHWAQGDGDGLMPRYGPALFQSNGYGFHEFEPGDKWKVLGWIPLPSIRALSTRGGGGR